MEVEAKKLKELEVVVLAQKKVEQQSTSYVEYLDEDCLFSQMFIDDDGMYIQSHVVNDFYSDKFFIFLFFNFQKEES